VSAVLLWHFAAALAASFAAPPASPLEMKLAQPFIFYYELLDQGQAHRYYAPEPPPTPIVTAKRLLADGQEAPVIRLPDRGLRPRLLYQRHLALANHLFVDYQRAKADPEGRTESPWAASYARHLCRTTPGCVQVTLYGQLHQVPDLNLLQEALARPGSAPLDLEDPRFFTAPERIGEFPCEPR
jgi:hypothetical protein